MHMTADIARDPETHGIPISAIGGIGNWRDAAEFISLSAGTVQVCTAAMHHGFRIVDDMITGLQQLDGFQGLRQDRRLPRQGRAQRDRLAVSQHQLQVGRGHQPGQLHQCGLCHIACEDTSHQSIAALRVDGQRRYEVITEECVGCNLCQHVCPVPDTISMVSVDTGKALSLIGLSPTIPHAEGAE
jgi:dihydropyrimidine dehydrogenase (NAD+) subunit PreA